MMRLAAALCAAILTAAASTDVSAEDAPPDRLARLLALEGDWRGELAYLDYGTGNREAIGQAAVMTASPDGAFLQLESRFTDPGFDVYILTIATFDPDTGDLVESYHRDRKIETQRFKVVSDEKTEAGWTLVLIAHGEDDDRPATIRRTFILDGDALTRRKEVDFLDDDESDFVFRNETILSRSNEPVTFDDFRQRRER